MNINGYYIIGCGSSLQTKVEKPQQGPTAAPDVSNKLPAGVADARNNTAALVNQSHRGGGTGNIPPPLKRGHQMQNTPGLPPNPHSSHHKVS